MIYLSLNYLFMKYTRRVKTLNAYICFSILNPSSGFQSDLRVLWVNRRKNKTVTSDKIQISCFVSETAKSQYWVHKGIVRMMVFCVVHLMYE